VLSESDIKEAFEREVDLLVSLAHHIREHKDDVVENNEPRQKKCLASKGIKKSVKSASRIAKSY